MTATMTFKKKLARAHRIVEPALLVTSLDPDHLEENEDFQDFVEDLTPAQHAGQADTPWHRAAVREAVFFVGIAIGQTMSGGAR